MNERSLVLFTLLSQAACGALVGLVGIQILGSADVLGPVSFMAVGLLLLAAAIIATLHLGAPRHAPYAVLNWRNSWLSREILMLGVTGSLVGRGRPHQPGVDTRGEPWDTNCHRLLGGPRGGAAAGDHGSPVLGPDHPRMAPSNHGSALRRHQPPSGGHRDGPVGRHRRLVRHRRRHPGDLDRGHARAGPRPGGRPPPTAGLEASPRWCRTRRPSRTRRVAAR